MRLSEEALAALQAAEVDGTKIFLRGELPRAVYEEVDKALRMLGGKWSRKDRAHVFPVTPASYLALVVTSGETYDLKKEFQFYETPPELAEHMVELAGIEPGMRVLEPSAGLGRIADAIRSRGVEPDVVEINPLFRDVLISKGYRVVGENFEGFLSVSQYDRIVANPPFAKGADVRHIENMLENLAPGGKIVTLSAGGWLFRTDRVHAAFRDRMQNLAREGHATWRLLPEGTFKESGTTISPVLLCAEG